MDKKSLIIIIVIILIILIWGFYFVLNKKPNQQTNLEQNPAVDNSVLLETANQEADQESQVQNLNSSSYEIQGMKIEILKEGTGVQAKNNDTVTVNYVGTLQNGTKFDSSIDRGVPFSFVLGQNSVIQGWELGVKGMKVGERRKLTIPPQLGYGANGVGNIIPPNATLIFQVDMLKISQ